MWSVGIVIDSPIFDGPPGVCEAGEPVSVQSFITEPAVEALDEGVLNGPARFDEV